MIGFVEHPVNHLVAGFLERFDDNQSIAQTPTLTLVRKTRNVGRSVGK
jgi:hypothetical protein